MSQLLRAGWHGALPAPCPQGHPCSWRQECVGAPGMAPLGAEGSWGLLGSQQVCARSCSSELVPSPEPGRKERWENPKSQHLSHSRDGYRDGISTCISHIQHIQPLSHTWDDSEWDFHIQPLSHSQDGSRVGFPHPAPLTQPGWFLGWDFHLHFPHPAPLSHPNPHWGLGEAPCAALRGRGCAHLPRAALWNSPAPFRDIPPPSSEQDIKPRSIF